MKRPCSSLLNFVEMQVEVALRIVVEAAELLQLKNNCGKSAVAGDAQYSSSNTSK